jgi:pyruvate/2-oxoglutarate dehydrogenase complex dihydrolipoamide acyltransferase (E2) component
VKVEVTEEGTNRRVILTNRAGGTILPGATYDEYADRGESENRHKELKLELHADRLSDHRFVANYFRLMMHSLAYNLLVRQRQFIALPFELDAAPAAAPSTATTTTATTTECSATATSTAAEPAAKSPSEPAASPSAASKKAPKSSPQRRQFNARRRQDPLGEGHITTWRTRIIKVACEVIVSTRRIVIRLSPSWPYLEQFLQVARANSVPLLT